MNDTGASVPASRRRYPLWLTGAGPLALIVVAITAFGLLDGPGLGDRTGPPVEDLVIERTTLRPGEIELSLRNDGPDAVRISQVSINDGFVPFESDSPDGEVGRLGNLELAMTYPWIEGEAYNLLILTSTGGSFEDQIEIAVETPEADASFFGLMALLGIYVGVIPISLGMLWLPMVRRISTRWIRSLMAFTLGLLAFLAVEAILDGLEIAADGPKVFGGSSLVYLGAITAFLALSGLETGLRDRRAKLKGGAAAAVNPLTPATLIAVGIGLHNLGEGLAIGAAYSAGALALGAFLVVGFAIHNTTEGLAIVAPLAAAPASGRRLASLGLVAGLPAVLGAWIGAAAFNTSIVAFLLGAGAGAILQVIVQIAPAVRDDSGRILYPLSVGGALVGLAMLWGTGLLVSV